VGQVRSRLVSEVPGYLPCDPSPPIRTLDGMSIPHQDAKSHAESADQSQTPKPEGERTKRVLLAKPRGYCAGVDRAVVTVEKALETYGPPVYVRKEIVHNRHVVDKLRERGVIFVDQTDEVPEGALVVFSAHGVSPAVHEEASRRNLRTIDATCPLVTKVHKEVHRYAKEDYDILLIGHEGHEEVEGTSGEAPERVQLVDKPEDVDQVSVRDPSKVVWLSQTTLSVDETMQRVDQLKERFPDMQAPPSDDICYATSNRQDAVKAMAAECDLVLVVGSQNSSNSQRLVEVARQAGASDARLIDYAHQIEPSWLDSVTTIGVTSGASVPDVLVFQVLDHLAERGWDEVDEVTTANEKITFALPRELRKDLDDNPTNPQSVR
jgi:4-hydroxy-3-methylbut-2-enyl diphosphate reductase